MSTGFIATAIVLIIGYVIVSRIIGLAFRLVVPLVLLVILGGAGVFSNLIPERAPDVSGGQVQQRSASDIGDLRLRDIADVAVDAVRSVLQGGLALLNGIRGDTESELRREPRWPDEQRRIRQYEPYQDQSDFADEPRPVDPPHRW
ncbi:hypothetical protein [Microvirga mediterraneensis]|uniref:Uncharacterized protein n=1 Tax=Microvirga mediterraneensis TaxID=2754695 RepID=A0A838BK47_9HYPH|nr:hypothetical protein [Microvirga mediterraneensis]MBA1156004.1 hypothetical protein [Microvirga mediterraneensis]